MSIWMYVCMYAYICRVYVRVCVRACVCVCVCVHVCMCVYACGYVFTRVISYKIRKNLKRSSDLKGKGKGGKWVYITWKEKGLLGRGRGAGGGAGQVMERSRKNEVFSKFHNYALCANLKTNLRKSCYGDTVSMESAHLWKPILRRVAGCCKPW